MSKSNNWLSSRKVFQRLLSVLILTGLCGFSLFSVGSNSVQAQINIEQDFFILIDVSNSMWFLYDQDDPTSSFLWNDLVPVIREYINNLPDDSNVYLYTFGETITPYGPWEDIDESAKEDILATFNGLSPSDRQTRFWDAVCRAVGDMSEIREIKGGDRFQTLMSFTDGEDTTQTNPESCLDSYDDLCVDGGAFWIHYAYGSEAEAFDDKPCTEIIKVEPDEADTDLSIKTALFLPSTLDLGNLYVQGTVVTKCLLFYASPSSTYNNQEYRLGSPKLIEGGLPSDVILKICEIGSADCNRENIIITQNESCLDFSLINYDPSDISYSREIIYEIPITRSDTSDKNFIVYPESFKVSFDLAPEPTITDTPTETPSPTPTPSFTPTASFTPTPSITPSPIPMSVDIRCEDNEALDFGSIKKPDAGQPILLEQACEIVFGEGEVPPKAQIALIWDEEDEISENLFQYIWLEQGGQRAKSMDLNPNDEDFRVVVDIPYDAWENLKRETFSGEIMLTTVVAGSKEHSTLPASFKVQPPLSPVFFAIPGVIVLGLAGLIIAGTRPRFPKDIQIESGGQNIEAFSSSADWWTGAIYLGGGSKAALGLGKEQENIVKINPSGKGSFLGQLIDKKVVFTAEVTPLGGTSIRLLGEAAETTESRTIYEGSEFGILNGDQYYSVKISRVEEQSEAKGGFGNDYKDDPFSGF